MPAINDQPTTLGYIFKTQGALVDAKRFMGIIFRNPLVLVSLHFLFCLKQVYSEKGK